MTLNALKKSDAEKADFPAQESMRLHPFYRGKIETAIKCCIRDFNDFAYWYSPGVAAPCRAIQKDPERVYDLTGKWNTVAVVSDGTRVLGLGDIGPEAGLPVMEGKALLFKYLGGVDAVPLMLDTKDPKKIIETVLMLQPSFGGINLEDIAQPKCFEVLDTLREQANIPVWHDDQQGTATVILAGLLNALKVVGKKLADVSIVFVGAGASNSSAARLIFAMGADPGRCRVVDSRGILGKHREDVKAVRSAFAAKWSLCEMTNAEGRTGDAEEAIRDADVVIACSTPGPGTLSPAALRTMKSGAVVFACANPIPEIWPWEAKEAGVEVFATGRSDFPNQVNNSLCFPGLFRGALDVRARTIDDAMCFAAAEALAGRVATPSADCLLPTMDDWEVFVDVAEAVGACAVERNIARVALDRAALRESASRLILRSRSLTHHMSRDGFIPSPPAP
ncbi:MAG: NADP-dependent malic enzyme [Kiritimatiellia bacterium]|nr:NADP-dependent malic enzyme [Kiritimatiellia bacterium]